MAAKQLPSGGGSAPSNTTPDPSRATAPNLPKKKASGPGGVAQPRMTVGKLHVQPAPGDMVGDDSILELDGQV